ACEENEAIAWNLDRNAPGPWHRPSGCGRGRSAPPPAARDEGERVSGRDIVQAATEAVTAADPEAVQHLIAAAVAAHYPPPPGDKPNNGGLIKAAGGSYDHKMIENLTNMQDAVLERRAVQRFGDLAAVPFDSPHAAAASLFAGIDTRKVAEQLKVTF